MTQGERLRIGEIARKASVAPSTIKFYMSKGLLPRPVKTSRNMAYYDRSTVERVRLIKELQEKAFLPLSVVRRILKNSSNVGEIKEYFRNLRPTALDLGFEPVEEGRILDKGYLTAGELRSLARMGVLDPIERDGKRYYSADDAAIVENLIKMRRAGFNPERGFRIEQMKVYQEALEKLAQKEMELALQGIVGKMKVKDLAAVAGEVMSSANEMIGIMHRKIVRRMLRSIRKEMEGRSS